MLVEFAKENGSLTAKVGNEVYRGLDPDIAKEFNEGERAEILYPEDEVSIDRLNVWLRQYAADLKYHEIQEMIKTLIREHLSLSNSLEGRPSSASDRCRARLYDSHMNSRGYEDGAEMPFAVYESEKFDFKRMFDEACEAADSWWESDVEHVLK